jgi:hypothetical protein
VLVCYSGFCTAFGAGNIPDFAFLEGKAYRHGDIEDILVEMLIRTASGESEGALDFFKKVVGVASEKFGSLNVKRTYFGNWLYDSFQFVIMVDATTHKLLMSERCRKVSMSQLSVSSFGYLVLCPSVTQPASLKYCNTRRF